MEPHAMKRSEGSDQETPGYRSPWRVLARAFEKSKTLQERIKAFRTEVRDLRRSRDRWRAKAEALEQETEELRSQLQRQAEQSPPAPSQRSRPILTQLSS